MTTNVDFLVTLLHRRNVFANHESESKDFHATYSMTCVISLPFDDSSVEDLTFDQIMDEVQKKQNNAEYFRQLKDETEIILVPVHLATNAYGVIKRTYIRRFEG